MTNRLAKAQAAAAKLAARAQVLRDAVATRRAAVDAAKASGRDAKALDRLVADLNRAERRADEVEGRAAAAAIKAKAAAAKAEQHADATASFNRRLDKVAAVAPATMERWRKDREDEPKRLAKRRKQLRRAVTRDLRPEQHVRRQKSAPAVVAATWPTGPIIPYEPPKAAAIVARDGLLPGDYRLVDPSPAEDIYRAPQKWTWTYVGRRLIDAHSTLRRLPMQTRPSTRGGFWPDYTNEGVELAYQAGAGTLLLGRNRIIGGTGSLELARMHEALAWPLEYLSDQPVYARAVNLWASRDGEDDRFVREALEFIAAKLNAKKVEVS